MDSTKRHYRLKGIDMKGMEMIFDMIRFADEKHKGQIRKGSGLDYFSHPMVGAFLLTIFKKSKHIAELICAFIGHDLLEDTDTTFIELATRFTPLVASLIQELTSNQAEIDELGKNEYFKIKLVGLSNYGLLLKLIDRLYNVSDQPKNQYMVDTLQLTAHLKRKRKLTRTHKAIIEDIEFICSSKLTERKPAGP